MIGKRVFFARTPLPPLPYDPRHCSDADSVDAPGKGLVALVDVNLDGFVSGGEVNNAIQTKLRSCCGERCPFFSDCSSISNSVLSYSQKTAGVGVGTKSHLTLPEFRDAIVGLGYDRLVPGCRRHVYAGGQQGFQRLQHFRSCRSSDFSFGIVHEVKDCTRAGILSPSQRHSGGTHS